MAPPRRLNTAGIPTPPHLGKTPPGGQNAVEYQKGSRVTEAKNAKRPVRPSRTPTAGLAESRTRKALRAENKGSKSLASL